MPNPHRKGITVPQNIWDSWQDYADTHGYSSRSALIRDAVEQLINRKTFPYTTPHGHTYVEPQNAVQARWMMTTAAQGFVEGWDEAELPPDPTWPVVSKVLQELEAATPEQFTHSFFNGGVA